MGKTSVDKTENKKGGIFIWVLFAFIPILAIIIAVLVISIVAGVNVFEKAKEVGSNVPVISKFIDDDSGKKEIDYEAKIVELEGQVRDRETLIAQLESQMEDREEQLSRLQLEKSQVEQSFAELETIQSEDKRAFKDIVKTYETISPKRAAPIISEMKDTEALKILANIKADTLAAILEKMDPKEAARFTELLAELEN